jgi:hypothetical protein
MVLVWGPAMVEAARTTASPAAIWTIVIVALVVLAFWLTAIMLADRYQVRTSGRIPVPDAAELEASDAQARQGLPYEQAAVPMAPTREPAGAAAQYARDGSVPEGDIPTRVDLPAQRSGDAVMSAESAQARPTTRPAMPAQRSGDADRAERSYTGQPPDEDKSDRSGPRP